jgi:hypothetical protein
LLLGAVPADAGGPTKPRNGTYSGVGNMVGDPSYSYQVGITLKGADVTISASVFTYPGCSGGVGIPSTTLGANKFESTASGANQEETKLKGRWVSNTKVKGKLIMERPSAASCGDPNTYVYRYTAKRYGKP